MTIPLSRQVALHDACIGQMPHLRAWLDRLHARDSFRRGLGIPFARPAFFGPPHASAEQIAAEIARNAGPFNV